MLLYASHVMYCLSVCVCGAVISCCTVEALVPVLDMHGRKEGRNVAMLLKQLLSGRYMHYIVGVVLFSSH